MPDGAHRTIGKMTLSTLSIGYIGLGAMGGALASRLTAAYKLHVWDLNRTAAERFEAKGATVCATAADVARRCRVILR